MDALAALALALWGLSVGNEGDKQRFFVTCARGTEGAVRQELAGMRIAGARGDRAGVWFDGPFVMGMGVCLHARVAVRVLMQVATFEVGDPQSLYAGARAVDWRSWLNARSTLAVHAVIKNGDPGGGPNPPREGPRWAKPSSVRANDAPVFTHSGYAALKVKDAVVDALRDALGARPDVDARSPDVAIVLHLLGRQASLFLDLAGEPLHRRGYRVANVEAPLKETLAAAVLSLGRVEADRPFVDPMAGSGTLAIEHAMAARGIAPGLRRRFGFERWPAFGDAQRASWQRLRAEAEAAAEAPRAPLPPIVCGDISPDALGAARRNASAASVDDDITFELADAADLDRRWPTGTVCTNPPYGERLSAPAPPERRAPARPHPTASRRPRDPRQSRDSRDPRDARQSRDPRDPRDARDSRDDAALGDLYRRLGRAFMRLSGWSVVVLSGNPLFSRALPGKPAVSHRLFNGPLEVRLLRYEIPAKR